MAGLFSRLKSGKEGTKSKKKNATSQQPASTPAKPQWDDAWTRSSVEPEEIHELIRFCTEELKSRALDLPFLLLPFRPTSDPSAVRNFIRHFFGQKQAVRGEILAQEIRMTSPMVLSGVVKWCWGRLQGGVVGWDAYELFKVGEYDSNMARDSFKTFIPISVENGARQRIIFDFFDLLAAVAAHGKSNGLGGRKLSRMAAWWAFEQRDTGNGFEGGYNAWLNAADATSHLFFAYLRSVAPEQNLTGISMLPMSLQKLLQETEYPPQKPDLMMSRTNKVVMIVETVSPTPFALLRRANHFQYRDSDKALQEFAAYEDPVQSLSEECKRVLKAVSAANQSQVSSIKHSTSLRDASWSRFEDIGFSSTLDDDDADGNNGALSAARKQQQPGGLRTSPSSGNGLGRPTTPSWADFLSSGFVDDNNQARSNLLLPPDKFLPPIQVPDRQRSSQSHNPRLETNQELDPGELASITFLDLDDAFWWVWMSSLAPEETQDRKAAFGRCAVVETNIRGGRWLVLEEMVAGAAPEPQEGAYIAEKKGFFNWTRRGKTLKRRKSTGKQLNERAAADKSTTSFATSASRTNIGPDTHAKIQAKAAQLRAASEQEKRQEEALAEAQRRGREGDTTDKTMSVLTMQTNIVPDASPAMRWVSKYDRGSIKDAYLANSNAGRGMALSPVPTEDRPAPSTNGPPTIKEDEPKTAPAVPAKSPEPKPETETEEEPVPGSEAAPPPGDESPAPAPAPADDTADSIAPAPTPSSIAHDDEEKPNKKMPKSKSGGFRKLFSRKNRSSKVPDNAAADINAMLRKDSQSTETSAAATPDAATPTREVATPANDSDRDNGTTGPDTPKAAVSGPTPPAEDTASVSDLSAVDARDAAEAKREFARFDQGPLDDQPAFSPRDNDDDDDDDGDATPPPIARRPVQRGTPSLTSSHEIPREERLSHTAGPGVQDRWAQIRKNAANRSATYQRPEDEQVPARSFHSRSHQGGGEDDDTSGEETIESRVARIKARVAELTGSMEGVNGPQSTTPSAHSSQGISPSRA
ncbi:protein of unknown function (DUF1708) [Geosmithia morbida]|uniref:Meiotically up-regulated protein Msb1/Mug8 domain-containing protein n=1 Tax=Geosmithia morbida TaxID=1094350 RepID=A0A9P4Z0H6_9HYPO|nr:protein of unknown function (DUF1708) [Geosmithia morbida]KAF4125171.1 protein of unknown function (DUF1708) [Geosmithia morbida]